MTHNIHTENGPNSSRRSILKAGSVATASSILGFSGTALADEHQDENGTNAQRTRAWMFNDEVRAGSLFQVSSPPLEEAPGLQDDAAAFLENATVRIVEYYNTNEEVVLFVPEDAQVEEDVIYDLSENFQIVEDSASEGIVEVSFQRADNQDFPFDLGDEEIEIIDGGGEGAIRPRNFSSGSLFRITSDPEGWVPDDVEESGIFTDYNTRHAEYLGTDDKFLFFPQEDAETEIDALYTIENEFEFFDPAGNLIAVEFNRVSEDVLTISEDFL